MAQTVTPLPSIGDVISGQDVPGRELRISGHPESDRVVLSIWQDGRCQATVRLARTDVPDVTRALVAGLVPMRTQANPGQPGTVHELRPGLATSTQASTLASPVTQLRTFTTRVRTRLQEFITPR